MTDLTTDAPFSATGCAYIEADNLFLVHWNKEQYVLMEMVLHNMLIGKSVVRGM